MTPRHWWKRAAAALKDRCSLCLARANLSRHHSIGVPRNPDLEAAVIKATSHDPSAIDYKNVGRVFAWARTSPSSSLAPLLWVLARRVERTRSWVVALKGLMLVHGVLLLCSEDVPGVRAIGRLPFDLSSFRDRSSKKSWGFTAFVRAYFNFLDSRSVFISGKWQRPRRVEEEAEDEDLACLRRLQRMQDLLDLLMQVRPYGDSMEVPLILEAMDCVIIEIFDVYSGICNGIAHALVSVFGPSAPGKIAVGTAIGLLGIRILKRASEQSVKLSRYFEVCRSLGVVNASDLPAVQSIPDQDIQELERLVMGGGVTRGAEEGVESSEKRGRGRGRNGREVDEEGEERGRGAEQGRRGGACSSASAEEGGGGVGTEGGRRVMGDGWLRTVVTREWVLFEDESTGHNVGSPATTANNMGSTSNSSNNPFLCSGSMPWDWEPVLNSNQRRAATGCNAPNPIVDMIGWENRDLLAL